MIGETLSHFRILEKIGEGGMGVVYEAEDEKLRRRVALKTLHRDRVGDPDRRRRLLREARSAAAVTHPNIAAVYEVDEVNDTVFVAMELVAGKTLRTLLDERRRLPVSEVLAIAAQLSDGLERAHRARLVHRDLKPENVFVDPAGHVKIVDFGLARPVAEDDPGDELDGGGEAGESETLTADLTAQGALVGTAAYMSPEQVRGRPLDGRSDLFAVGILIYEMLTGRRPFQGATAIDTVSAILRDVPPPAGDLRPEIPPELDRVLGRLLAKERARRIPTAANLAFALRALQRPAATIALAGVQATLCICGRSQELPYCDGSHASQDWSCAGGAEPVRFAFCAARRYRNLARKLAAHYQGAACLEGEPPCAPAEILVTVVDGSDLDFPRRVHETSGAARKLVATLGVAPRLLRGLFPGAEMVDLSEVQPLYAFKRISALLDSGEPAGVTAAPESGPALRSAFISHAVADEPLILPVKAFLEQTYRADVFTCADSIRPGSEWQAEIMRALREREQFVFALSRASLDSHFCSFEVGVAHALGKPIRIVSLDGSRPPVFIQHLQTVDLERIGRTRPWLERHDILLEELLKILA